MADKLTTNCSTGTTTTSPLTDDELADREARAIEAAASETKQTQREQRRQAAIDQLTTIANAGDLTAQQAKNAVQYTAKVLAKVLPFIDIDPG